MKVLYATNMYPSDYKPFSGIFIKEQIEMLHKTFGLKYSIVTGGGSNNNPIIIIKKYLVFFFKIFWNCTFNKFDIIHAHFSYPTGFITLLSKIFNSSKFILTVHGSDILDTRIHFTSLKYWANKLTLSFTHAIIAVSENLKNEIIQSYNIPSEKIHVIDMGVNNDIFFNQTLEPTKSGNEFHFLFIGRFVKVKGFQHIIEAFRHIIINDPDLFFKCTVIGTGADEENYKATITHYNLEKYFDFIGPKKQSDIALWMNKVDTVIIPSQAEGFGLVAIESLACGTPVIGSAVGIMPSIIKNDLNGFLFQPENNYDLATKIKFAMTNKTNISINNCIKSVIPYSQNFKVKQTFNLYERAVL